MGGGVSFISWYCLVDKCLFSLLCMYQDGMYKSVTSSDRVIDVRVRHACSSSASIYLCCLDEKGNHTAITVFHCMCLEPSIGYDMYFCVCTVLAGNEHNIKFMYCQCEPLVVTMVRARLWPATAQHPRLAFAFELLDWPEALLLECQVALKGLCKALSFFCPQLTGKV